MNSHFVIISTGYNTKFNNTFIFYRITVFTFAKLAKQISFACMKKSRSIIVLSMLCLIALLYAQLGPFRAAYGIHQSIEREDFSKLERYIDFPELREATKSQLRSYLADMSRGEFSDPSMQLLFSGWSMSFTDGLVDGFLQPENLASLLAISRGVEWENSLTTDEAVDQKLSLYEIAAGLSRLSEWCSLRYLSWSEFAVTFIKSDSPLVGTQIFFQRRGLDWVLSSVRFSDVFWQDALAG